MEARFHEANAAKTASLDVDYRDGVFSAPADVIGEEAVAGIAAVNAYLLDLADPTVRVAHRMAKEDRLYGLPFEELGERPEKLKDENAEDVPVAFGTLMNQMLDHYQKARKN